MQHDDELIKMHAKIENKVFDHKELDEQACLQPFRFRMADISNYKESKVSKKQTIT